MLEFDVNNFLSYNPTCVIFLGKKFTAPVDIVILLAWQLIYNILINKKLNQ
jgi:hypothetical protein